MLAMLVCCLGCEARIHVESKPTEATAPVYPALMSVVAKPTDEVSTVRCFVGVTSPEDDQMRFVLQQWEPRRATLWSKLDPSSELAQDLYDATQDGEYHEMTLRVSPVSRLNVKIHSIESWQ